MRSLWLMYHDVYTQLDSEVPRTAAMYHVSRNSFASQMQMVQESGLRVVRPLEAQEAGPGQALVITFDDGWTGAFRNAVPVLKTHSYPAVIFVTRDFVGRKGFCNPTMLREAAQAGAEIGVHGTTHRMLSALSDEEIFSEFSVCKDFLEQAISAPVRLASLPGGDVNDRIIAGARKAGLKCLCTSQPGVNSNRTSSFRLRRIAIRENTDSQTMKRFCHLAAGREVFRWAVLEMPRLLLGMKNYSYLRRAFVDFRSCGKTREIFRP
jgi:peptidoglycan/xylan/chitin deacetylase (PgdA/CDA1 family)